MQPQGKGPKLVASKQLQQSGKQSKSFVSVGLVFDLFETDVRQYLQTGKRFTTGGTQHVLSSVLDGLAYMHGKGLVHSDISQRTSRCEGRLLSAVALGEGRGQHSWLQQRRGTLWSSSTRSRHPSRRDPPSSTGLEIDFPRTARFDLKSRSNRQVRIHIEIELTCSISHRNRTALFDFKIEIEPLCSFGQKTKSEIERGGGG